MGKLEVKVDEKRQGIRGIVLSVFDKFSKKREAVEMIKENQGKWSNLFAEPKRDDYDKIIDQLASEYWEKFPQEVQRMEIRTIMMNIMLAIYKELEGEIENPSAYEQFAGKQINSTITINKPFKEVNYPLICAYIKTAYLLGLDIDTPMESVNTDPPLSTPQEVICIPVIGGTSQNFWKRWNMAEKAFKLPGE